MKIISKIHWERLLIHDFIKRENVIFSKKSNPVRVCESRLAAGRTINCMQSPDNTCKPWLRPTDKNFVCIYAEYNYHKCDRFWGSVLWQTTPSLLRHDRSSRIRSGKETGSDATGFWPSSGWVTGQCVRHWPGTGPLLARYLLFFSWCCIWPGNHGKIAVNSYFTQANSCHLVISLDNT